VSDLKRNFLSQSILATTQLLFPLITYPYAARVLGPSGIGKVSYIEFTTGLIITLFSIGIPYYGVREIAKLKNDKQRRAKLTSELILIHFIFSILSLLAFIALISFNQNFQQEKQLMFYGSLFILLQVFTIEWYLQGVEAFQFIAWRSIFIRLLAVISIFLFVKTGADYVIYYIIILGTQFFVAVISLSKAFQENSLSFRSVNLKTHLRPLFYFFLTSSFVSVYVFFDTVILGWLTNKEHVGYYTFALRIVKLPLLLLLTLNTVLYPRMSSLHHDANEEKILSLSRFTSKFFITITIPICFCFYLLAPEIIALLGGKDFTPSIKVIQWLSPLPLLLCFSNFFVWQILAPSHKERLIMRAVLFGSVISLLLNFLLIPQLKEQGAAIAVLTTEGIVFLISLYFSFEQARNYFSLNNLFISIAISLLTIPIVLLTRAYFVSPLYILVISLFSFSIFYFLLQYLLFGNEVMQAIANFINPFANKNQVKNAKGI
jgi:O-antigen/teichoic acid export membrane protein